MSKTRLIDVVITRQICGDRDQARQMILAGNILVNGHKVYQPAMQVKSNVEVSVLEEAKPVSRAGQKLEHALKYWNISINGLIAADIGAASGGFTECLLDHGARRVYAIETGKGQLAWKLRQDDRVIVMEQTNILRVTTLPEALDLVVVDTSWTPLRRSLPAAERLLVEKGKAIALLKPNYELQDESRLTDGVLTDDHIRQSVVQEFLDWAVCNSWVVHGVIPSPVTGDKGNIEFLVYMSRQ